MVVLRVSALVLAIAGTGCVNAPPIGADRGVLFVGADLSESHIRSVEFMHQRWEHIAQVTGFLRGQDIVHERVPAGPYCLRRIIVRQGVLSYAYKPTDVCFDVVPNHHTYLGTFTRENGRIALVPDGPRLADEIAARDAWVR